MRNLAALGFKKYGDLPFPPFANSVLEAFELKFGVKLPSQYISLLRLFNGGRLTASEYDDPVMGLGAICYFYGLARQGAEITAESREWELGNLWEETAAFHLHLLNGRGIPFARDGGGNQLFLDFESSESNPPVGRVIVATRKSYRIANSFSEFVNMLHENTMVTTERSAGKPRERRVN